jgi:hypothetical protein
VATFDEAKRCPICKEVGNLTHTANGDAGSKIHTFTCQKSSCKWFNTGWLVQVLRDGTIPERPKGESEFPSLDVFAALRGDQMVADIMRSITTTTEKRPGDR